MGTNNDRKLGLAFDYLKYLGTADLTNDQIKQEFFKIGCSFDVFNSFDQVYVSLSGLSENFEKGLSLFERLLSDAKPNPEALKNLVNDEMKKRKDAKLNPQEIFGAMVMYGIFGPKSPATNILSEKELTALTADELTALIKSLNSYDHHVLFYGSQDADEVKGLLEKHHNTPAVVKPVPTALVFPELATDQNLVYQVNFDMKQAQILMLSRGETFNASTEPVIKLYNEYFGGSMNSIVFQELRESRALCYAAMSFYQNLFGKKDNHYYNISFIMTQNDKIEEGLSAFYELLNNMPLAEKSFDLAKSSLIQSMRTERITKSDILFSYEKAKKIGLDYDIRKDIFNVLPKLTFEDIKAFQAAYVKGKPQTTLVLGNEKLLDFKVLKKYGKVKKLKLKSIFGY
jgi:predicted Zn-dependent peptidase